MTDTAKVASPKKLSFLFPDLTSQASRSSDPILPFLANTSPAALTITKAIPPPMGEAARESLESSDLAQSGQGAVFQKSADIAATTDVALSSHQILSDSFPGAADPATRSGRACCGCRACTTLSISTDEAETAWASTDQAPIVLNGGVTLDAGVDLSQVFQLHSNPTATKTIFLDFDGHTVNNTPWENGGNLSLRSFYSTFDSTALTEIQRIWQRVAEDFAPFNVNVTTQDPGSENLRKSGSGDDRWGIRVAFTSNHNLLTGKAITNAGGGGTAYYNSFNWSTDDVALVFNRGEYTAAETASHEVGHALNLRHDGVGTTTYYAGHGGTGPTSWGTIMGAAWLGPDENLTQWSKGEYTGANNTQDDLAVITTGNGFGYRDDDHGNTFATATALSGLTFSSFGIIERNTDIDMFRFDTGAGLVSFDIVNASRAYIGSPGNTITEYLASRGPNLDIAASLYRANGSLLQTFNPADLTTASFSINLDAGTYYLGIDGVGFGNPFASTPTGYTDYGSLGQYMLSGTVQASSLVSTSSTPPPPAPTILVTSSGTLTTTEAGGSTTFQVALSRVPSSDVSIRLSSSDSTEGIVTNSTLVFTAANWQTPQTVTVQGVDDSLVDGTQTYNILMSSTSSDPAFNGLTGPTLLVQNLDNDVASPPPSIPVTFQASTGQLRLRTTYTQAPTVVGTLDAINASDDQRLEITEGSHTTSKGPAISLNQYELTFDNLNNATQLVFEGYRTANPNNDNFRIQYKIPGSKWATAFTVSNVTENTYTFNLPSAVSGSAMVRIVDTVTGASDETFDTLYIDRLVFMGSTAASAIDPIIGGGTSLAPAVEPAVEPVIPTDPFLALAGRWSVGADTSLLAATFPIAGLDTSATTPWLVAPQPLL